MGDEVKDAFDAFDRSWAQRQGVFECRTIHRELELMVMLGQVFRNASSARVNANSRQASRSADASPARTARATSAACRRIPARISSGTATAIASPRSCSVDNPSLYMRTGIVPTKCQRPQEIGALTAKARNQGWKR
jgi:hypothetical protein